MCIRDRVSTQSTGEIRQQNASRGIHETPHGTMSSAVREAKQAKRERVLAKKASRMVQEHALMMANVDSRRSNEQACLQQMSASSRCEGVQGRATGLWNQLEKAEVSTGINKYLLLGGAKVAGAAVKIATVAILL
eukprot:TRINITY_DN5971_c0_g1_i1.p1 TRINITY_DN5971_c0_g1~~TRINITY_DN5971_c0_g1_i1.p1  ORF type:complete len:135 (+),score=27.62 TRINITY_DN5971_c0_g1_i1:129-533(+)